MEEERSYGGGTEPRRRNRTTDQTNGKNLGQWDNSLGTACACVPSKRRSPFSGGSMLLEHVRELG